MDKNEAASQERERLIWFNLRSDLVVEPAEAQRRWTPTQQQSPGPAGLTGETLSGGQDLQDFITFPF